MLEAVFQADGSREAAVAGAYQYDTGQRIRMHGLPSPDELAQMDELLNVDAITVQAQYSYKGDAQTETRLCMWSEEDGVWMADVPNAYLTRCASVQVFFYVLYGVDGELTRGKTVYEASFTPIHRPAPGTQVTPEQGNAWDVLVQEVNLTLASMNTAISSANAATQEAYRISGKIDNLTAEATSLPEGSEATAQVIDTEDGSGKKIILGIPPGRQGVPGPVGFTSINGITPDEEGKVTLTPADIGALSMFRVWTLTFPAANWSENAPYMQTVTAEGMLESDVPDADVDMSGATADTASDIAAAWSLIGRIDAGDGAVTAVCFEDRPEIDLTIRMKAVR